MPLLRGRMFSRADRQGAPKVVLINETAARKFWPNEDPIGKPVGVGQGGFADRAEVIAASSSDWPRRWPPPAGWQACCMK